MSAPTWKTLGRDEFSGPACSAAERARDEAVEMQFEIQLSGETAFFKGNRIPPRAGRRHARRSWFGRLFPALAEFTNLERLREAGFPAPQPLAAGCWVAGRRPLYQFLATRRIADARSLAEVLRKSDPERRVELFAGPARILAKLHERGLAHRNPFVRNWVLAEGRLWMVDVWRMTRALPRRGAAYDLACLLLEASDQERVGALSAYIEKRGGELASWSRSVERATEPLRRRAAREAARRATRAQDSARRS